MGKVYLVGAGPGAPDLLTLRAARLLERADIVFYDALVHPETVAMARQARLVPVGKRCGAHSAAQRFINRALVDAGHKYGTVVRLKGGDPMLFGRAHEEMEALDAAGIAYEIVPGVTAALAASAEAKISLTRRGLSRSVTFATPRVGVDQEAAQWAEAVAASDTVALYMAAGQGAAIAAQLQAQGMRADTPVLVVESASLPTCRKISTTLAGLAQAPDWQLAGPALVLMGEVYRESLAAAAPRPVVQRRAAQ